MGDVIEITVTKTKFPDYDKDKNIITTGEVKVRALFRFELA